jgi:hypothetical protein
VAAQRLSKDAKRGHNGPPPFAAATLAPQGDGKEHETMPDFLGLMKQATELKSKMEAMQAELDRMEVEGAAGGGLVTLKISGKGDLRGVKLDDSLLKPDQKEILEDLIVAAHTEARRKLEGMLAEKMQAMTGGLPLPPGLKLF